MRLFTFCALFLTIAAPSAGSFTVTLHNGGSFESRYQPRAAGWDENVLLVLDEHGNWIGLERADVKSVVSAIETRGYGRIIDTTTKEFGFAPNDAALPDEGGGAGGGQEAPSALDRILSQSYDTPQFAEPGSSGGGFPVFGVTTGPSGGGGGTQINEPTPQ